MVSRILSRRSLLVQTGSLAAGLATIGATSDQPQGDFGTPETIDTQAAGPGKIESWLAMIPAALVETINRDRPLFWWADLKRQFESVGAPAFDAESNEFRNVILAATFHLGLDSMAFQPSIDEVFISTFGFSAFQTHETMRISLAESNVLIFRGGMPIDDLAGIWEAVGFIRETSTSGIEIWSFGDDGMFDLGHEASTYFIDGMTNATILDETVIFSNLFPNLESIANHRIEKGTSILDLYPFTDLLATLTEDIVAAVGLAGDYFELSSIVESHQFSEPPREIDPEISEPGVFPVPICGMFAITAGMIVSEVLPTDQPDLVLDLLVDGVESNVGVVESRLAFATPDEAETASELVEDRWNSLQSLTVEEALTDLMVLDASGTDDATPTIATFDFQQLKNNRTWRDMILTKDLLAFAWVEDSLPQATPEATPSANG